ncbi:hypothetical protein D3C73_993900 [compost metagenome]
MVVSQGRVGLCVTVQVVDEAIQQFVGGVEVQLLVVAWAGLLECGPQAAHPCRQRFLVGGHGLHQARRIRAGQGATTEAVEHFGKVLQAGFDRGHHMIRRTGAQAFEQLVQGVEARGQAHEFAVQAAQSTVSPAHVRVFEHGDAAQPLQAHCLGAEPHVAGLERLALAAAAQAVGDEQGEHAKALVQGIAHRRAGGLRQDRGADHGGAKNPQGNFQHAPHGGHERTLRVGQRRQADHRGGVAGQHEAIGAEVAIARGTRRADADPDRQRA